MTNILVLGAHGQIACVATEFFLAESPANLPLYLRNARRLNLKHPRVRVSRAT